MKKTTFLINKQSCQIGSRLFTIGYCFQRGAWFLAVNDLSKHQWGFDPITGTEVFQSYSPEMVKDKADQLIRAESAASGQKPSWSAVASPQATRGTKRKASVSLEETPVFRHRVLSHRGRR